MDIASYITFDLPIPYKTLMIYPATVKDYMTFMSYVQCLTLEKNSIPDPKIISMSELEYLYYSTTPEGGGNYYLFWFDRVLATCLKDDKTFEKIEESISRYNFYKDGRPYFKIAGEEFTANDYEEIRKIICQQNLVEIPDENIQKEVRDSLAQAKRFKERLTDGIPGTLEDYMVSLAVVTGWTYDYIQGLSIRRFTRSLQRMDMYIHYKILLSASMSGMVEFKDKSIIKHWLNGIEDEKYKDVSMDMETIQNKVSLESAKEK